MHKDFDLFLTGFIVISFGVIIMIVGLAHDGQNNLGWHNGHLKFHKLNPFILGKAVNKVDVETANVPISVQTGIKEN